MFFGGWICTVQIPAQHLRTAGLERDDLGRDALAVSVRGVSDDDFPSHFFVDASHASQRPQKVPKCPKMSQ